MKTDFVKDSLIKNTLIPFQFLFLIVKYIIVIYTKIFNFFY